MCKYIFYDQCQTVLGPKWDCLRAQVCRKLKSFYCNNETRICIVLQNILCCCWVEGCSPGVKLSAHCAQTTGRKAGSEWPRHQLEQCDPVLPQPQWPLSFSSVKTQAWTGNHSTHRGWEKHFLLFCLLCTFYSVLHSPLTTFFNTSSPLCYSLFIILRL